MVTTEPAPTFAGSFWQWLTKPVMATLLRMPRFCWLLLLLAVIQVSLSVAGWHLFQCPLMQAFRVPCPGCGLTRATRLFATGEFMAAVQMHLFAPIALLTLAFLLGGSILPPAWREVLARQVEGLERKTGISQLLFMLLLIYWIVRLVFLPDQVDLLRL